MAVSVIIVSYNSSALLVECVHSVLASPEADEVIVSDNGSTDCAIEALEDLAGSEPRLRVVRNGRNLGFAAANNVALELARGDRILFLNPDCLLAADTIARLLDVLDRHTSAGMVGCLIRNPDGSEQAGCRRQLPTPGSLFGQLLGRRAAVAAPLPAGPVAVEAISGAFMLVRREVLRTVGSFDEGYFMHWEDLDLCLRIRRAGHDILFVPDVEIVHFKGRSSRRHPLRVEWYKHVGLMRYFRKFHFAAWPSPLFGLVAVAIALRFLVQAPRCLRSAADDGGGAIAAADGRAEIWVFGASSLVGRCLLPRLVASGYRVRAFSTDPAAAGACASPHLTWHEHDIRDLSALPSGRPDVLINLAPVPLLPPWVKPLAEAGLKRLIAFSSTSRFTKKDSARPAERQLAAALAAAEDAVAAECGRQGVAWAIFRPTLIYHLGHDRNITLLAGFIRRFGFFPLPGQGRGLRQPVHADDLARACLALLDRRQGWNQAYDLSGGETLSYRAMVETLFRRLGRSPRIVTPPLGAWRALLALARCLPAYRGLHMEMIVRADMDMCFDHEAAARQFGYAPRPFLP